MKLEVPSSSSLCTDDDQNNLNYLLEAFGSVVSLEDIASAYCQAGRDMDITTDILSSKPDNTVGSSTSKNLESTESAASVYSGCSSDNPSEKAIVARLKPKRSSASMGTVSCVIGREYISPKPQPNESHENHKPVKLNSDDFPVSEIWKENEVLETTSRGESMNHDMEEFLFKMLGKGFQMDMSVIHDVVGQCGYDMQTSVDKLLDLSASTLEKSDDVVCMAAGNKMEIDVDLESMQSNGKSVNSCSASTTELTLPRGGMKNNDVQREVLNSLFRVPGKIEEKPESARPVRLQTRRSPYGQVVTKPLEETLIGDFTFITRQLVNNRDDEGNNDEYEELRKAVIEYWTTMKDYYRAAVDAFTNKDNEKAQKFLEKGHFFMKKARESDEKSAQKLIGNSSNGQEELLLNMHYFDPKDAVKHLRIQLTSWSGLPSLSCLKIVVGTNGEDTKEGRRKRLITKLLEKEGIPWTEEGNGWILSIRIDQIDPKKLSFANK
ncbi:LOW QUALITY PROTEIN: putative nuclear RNA export factor SDE5 [Primulina tabacum]|uniref:LOW QUALITY PROTEIN: putative nuclear RNA export factor SDE5 n=1 Tax=Primulina tabacum TaxID=48773 RepID=UPI003F5ABE6D